MGDPIVTALFLITAGLLAFRLRDWTHRWIGFMLISAGMNVIAGISDELATLIALLWVVLIGVLCIIAVFEEPQKN